MLQGGGRLPSAIKAGPIVFLSFDLLYLDGHDLRRLPLRERRRLLEPLVAGREGAIRLSEEVDADGAVLRPARRALKALSASGEGLPLRPGRVVAEDHLEAARQLRGGRL